MRLPLIIAVLATLVLTDTPTTTPADDVTAYTCTSCDARKASLRRLDAARDIAAVPLAADND